MMYLLAVQNLGPPPVTVYQTFCSRHYLSCLIITAKQLLTVKVKITYSFIAESINTTLIILNHSTPKEYLHVLSLTSRPGSINNVFVHTRKRCYITAMVTRPVREVV